MEKIRIYSIYDYNNQLVGPLGFQTEIKFPDKICLVKSYSSMSYFQVMLSRSEIATPDVLIVHLGLNTEKEDPEKLERFIRETRERYPFCRIGIQSGVYAYLCGGERTKGTIEELLKRNLPDFYFILGESLKISDFLIEQVAKGPLTLEEVAWREAGNVLTEVVDFGSRGLERK